jgi:hypothetical protein
MNQQLIPILSLIIAALAVLVAPAVQWRIAKRQIVAPMRQAWINELRKKLSKLLGSASYFIGRGVNLDQDSPDIRELAEIQQEIIFTLNPLEEDHHLLIERLTLMMDAAMAKRDVGQYKQLHGEITQLTFAILKREWNRVRD